MEKYTYDDIKKDIFEESNGQILLLSKDYVNSKTPLKMKCICGEEFERSYDNFMRGQHLCRKCSRQKIYDTHRLDFKEVLKVIEDQGCEYISGEYQTVESKLLLRCSCGNTFLKSFKCFQRGESHCKECGNKIRIEKTRKYDLEKVKHLYELHGFTYLDKDYSNANTPYKCICSKGHITNKTLASILNNEGCSICSHINKRGANSALYRDESTKIIKFLRYSLNPWKDEIRQLYNDVCPITGKRGNECIVHHLLPIKQIYDSVCNEYGVECNYNNKMKDFSSYELLFSIRDRILELHTFDVGILISKELHIEFHKQYGYYDASIDDFDKYLRQHYNTTLSEVLKS